MWFHFFSLAIFAQVLILNGSFFVLYLLLLPSETPMYMLFGSPGVLRNLLLFGCGFLKLLVWMLAPEKASQVLTHGRESLLPLCLCFWEVPWLWGVRSQLPFVNCLKFFFFLLFWFSPHECQAWHEGWTFSFTLSSPSSKRLSFCILDVVCSWSRPMRHRCLETGLSDDQQNIRSQRERRAVSLCVWKRCTSNCSWNPVCYAWLRESSRRVSQSFANWYPWNHPCRVLQQ